MGLAAAAATCIALASADARADAASDAKTLFLQGRALRSTGDCAAALPLFHRAFEVYPAGLGSLRNIAECEEELGHYALARNAWLDLQRDLAAEPDPRYEGWAQDAEHAAARLEPRAASETAEAPKPGPAPSAVVPAPVTKDASPGGGQRIAAWTAIGVGAAAFIGAGISWAVRQSAIGTLTADGCHQAGDGYDCTGVVDPSLQRDAMDAKSRGETATTLANVLTVVGAVGVAGGVVLLVTSPASRSSRAALLVSPTGVWGVGRF